MSIKLTLPKTVEPTDLGAVQNLISAVVALANEDNGRLCFCDVSIDNPMLHGKHTDNCNKLNNAVLALTGAV